MIPDLAEILASLRGAWRLIKLDAGGFDEFNLSVEGFWRSFFAMVVAAPIYVLLLVLVQELPTEDLAAPRSMALSMLSYVIGWIIGVLVVLLATRLLGRGGYFARLVIALNWLSVPLVVLFAVIYGFAALAPTEIAGLLYLLTLPIYVFYYSFVVRRGIEVNLAPAIGVALLLLVVSILVDVVLFGL